MKWNIISDYEKTTKYLYNKLEELFVRDVVNIKIT